MIRPARSLQCLMVFFFSLAAACHQRMTAPRPEEFVRANQQLITTTLQLFQNNYRHLASGYQANLKLKTTLESDGKRRQLGTFKALLVTDTRRFRIKATAAFGVELFDMLATDQTVTLIVPSKKLAIVGPRGANQVVPFELLSHFFEKATWGTRPSTLVVNNKLVILKSDHQPVENDWVLISQVISLDPDTGWIQREDLLLADRPAIHLLLSGHRSLGAWGFPQNFRIESRPFYLTGRIDSISILPNPKESAFQLEIPDGFRVVSPADGFSWLHPDSGNRDRSVEDSN